MSGKRRGRGEGTVYLNARLGLWVGMVSLPSDASGKRRRRALYAKKRGDLVAKMNDAKLDVSKGEYAATPSRKTVAAFLAGWIEDTVKPAVRPNTFDSYARVVRRHILSGEYGIGHLRIKEVKAADLQSFYGRMEKRKVGRRTQQLTHAVLHKAFERALRQELIAKNPASLVSPPRYQTPEMRVLSVAQLKELLTAAAGDRLAALYALAVFSGCRQGELLGLHWQDVDLKRGTIQIRRSLQDLNGSLSVAETKTEKSRRMLHLPRIALTSLRTHKKLLEREGLSTAPTSPVFADSTGGYLRRQNVMRRSFKPMLKQAGLPDIRFHDLRHSAATMMLSMGVHPKIVQEQLGHARIGITLDTYSHALPALQREAAATVNAAFTKSHRKR